MIEIIRNSNASNDNSEDIKKQLEAMQGSETEEEKSEEIFERLPEETGKEENAREEAMPEAVDETESFEETVNEKTIETTEITTGSAIQFDMFGKSYTVSKQSLFIALGLVLAVLASLIYSSRKKKAEPDRGKGEKGAGEMAGEKTVSTEQEENGMKQNICPFSVGKLHEIGAREDQQDSFGVGDFSDIDTYQRKGLLAVVADGMGGLSNGGAVSSLAVKTCHDVFYSMQENKSAPDMLLEMAAICNNQINQMLQGQRSGSTLVSAIVREGYLYFLTIGDSHIYLYRDGALILLNREHIYKEELSLQVINGMLPVDRANYDAQAKSLTSYLGAGKITHFDRNQDGIRLLNNDRIILASDGVFGTLTPEQMEEALKLSPAEAAVKMKDMIETKGKKHQDNYTALILEYKG